MGLELLQMQNKLAENARQACDEYALEETRARLLVGLIAILLYLLIGAAVFVRIEAPVEQYEVEAYESFRVQWTKRLRRKGIGEEDVDKLFANIRDAALHGVWREANVSSEPNWTFGKSFFFAATLISTVGYGNISPQTPHGKVFTIVYCIVGIPLTLSLISALSARLRARPSAWLRERINLRFGGSFHVKHLQIIHLLALASFVLVFAFIIPSLIFIAIENDWSFIDAFFFCFVSLSTIGLGDYVPGDGPNQPLRGLYKIFVAVYLIFGLCCMMVLLGTLYDLPQFNLVRYFITRTVQPPDAAKDNAAVPSTAELRPMNGNDSIITSGYGYNAGDYGTPGLPYNMPGVAAAPNPFQSRVGNVFGDYANSNPTAIINPNVSALSSSYVVPPATDYNNPFGAGNVSNIPNYYQS